MLLIAIICQAVGLLGLFACESEVKPGNTNRYKGQHYIGLGQHCDDLCAGRDIGFSPSVTA